MQSTYKNILSRIYGNGRGWCFSPNHFLDLGSREAIRITLFRLAEKGTIRRLAQGLYDYPKRHAKLGLLYPAPNAIARALAGGRGLRIQASGGYAANLLGLSEQVPARSVFLTDGRTRRIRIGPQEIILKNTAPRNMVTAGRMSGTVIQALRHLGAERISKDHILRLKQLLTLQEKACLRKDLIYAPSWMHSILRQVAREDNQCD